MLLHRKSTFKEFSNSKEKIATNILTSRLHDLVEAGFVSRLTPRGTKKSAVFIANPQGICALPLLVELYMFSIGSLAEEILNEAQLAIKAEILKDKDSFIAGRRAKYIEFVNQIQSSLVASSV